MGIPVRGAPPGVVGVVDVCVDVETTLLEPEPHIPDTSAVSSIPELVDSPDEVIPDAIDVPDVAALAGIVVAADTPPPSKVAPDRNVPVGEVPKAAHVVPKRGTEIVPIGLKGAGLMPGDVISVDPRGRPVEETGEPAPMPSGEVAPSVGSAGLMAWAKAEPDPK